MDLPLLEETHLRGRGGERSEGERRGCGGGASSHEPSAANGCVSVTCVRTGWGEGGGVESTLELRAAAVLPGG